MWNVEKIVKKGDYLYAVVRGHPNASQFGYVLLHRVVMENHLNRLLSRDEVVHHKDHNRMNNMVDNLEVMSRTEHNRLHGLQQGRTVVVLCCPWCRKIFKRRRGQTHLVSGHGSYTACSRSCSGKISTSPKTHELHAAISENVLEILRENSEQTATTGCVETIRRAPETVKK